MGTGTKQFFIFVEILAATALALPAFAGSTYQNSYCDAFCDQLVDVNNGQVLGLNGQDGWTAADDESCALAEGATPSPGASPVPLPSDQTQAFQCEWHAGQALNYCEAYVLPQASAGFEKTLTALDVAAAGTCWAACASKAVDLTTLDQVCGAVSVAASATEFIDSLKMAGSPLVKAVQTSLAGLGAVGGVAELDQSLANAAIGKATNGKDEFSSHRDACLTAAVMTVTAVLRAKDMEAAKNAQQNACNSIQQLASNAPVISPIGVATATANSGGGAAAPPPGAMAMANGPLSNGQQPASAACAQGGLGAGGCGFSSAQMSAPDAQMLNSGLGQAVAAQAAQQEPALMNQLGSSGGSPGGTIGQALAANAPSADIAKAISTLAAKAADAPGGLGDDSQMGGGAGGGGGAEQAHASVFSFGQDDNTPVAGAPETTFRAPSQIEDASGDIFHSNFKGSIFQIISQKMSTVRGRVAQLQWSTPLNRALAGDAMPAPVPQGVTP